MVAQVQQVQNNAAPHKRRNTRAAAEETSAQDRVELTPVKVSYVPQEIGMLPMQVGEVLSRPDALSNERFQVSVGNGFPKARPDAEGHFRLDDPGDPRLDSANAFYIANQALSIAETYANSRISWAFEDTLGHPMLIRPHAGKDVANAYYNSESGSLNFFSYLDENTGERQRTGMSFDIVAHETGHAILDGLRPHLIKSMSVGGGGFHETFADMTSMLTALHDPHIVEALRVQTKGDLSQPNLVSGMAEQLGYEPGQPLREAVNDHKYADQAFLPYSDPKNPGSGLGTECHSYANLFNGAFYELFNRFYDEEMAKPNASFQQAVGAARDRVGQLLLRSVEMGPVGDTSFREAAVAFVRADLVDNDGANWDALVDVFSQRKILRSEDFEAVTKAQENLPEISWSEDLAEKDKAEAWLDANREALGLPADVPFEFDRIRTTNSGERFVTFTTSRKKGLEGASFGDYEGAQIRLMGGVLLGFNGEGELITHQYDGVSDRELEDTLLFFEGSLALGQIRDRGEVDSFKGKKPPRMQIQSVVENGNRVLRRAGSI